MCNDRDVTKHYKIIKSLSICGERERHDSKAAFLVLAAMEITWGALKTSDSQELLAEILLQLAWGVT